ncbi:hypothetical protein DJ56_4180 [Yersinia pestis]|nr:hypothetical protein DJ56_4180 [Yersinia pestis]
MTSAPLAKSMVDVLFAPPVLTKDVTEDPVCVT